LWETGNLADNTDGGTPPTFTFSSAAGGDPGGYPSYVVSHPVYQSNATTTVGPGWQLPPGFYRVTYISGCVSLLYNPLFTIRTTEEGTALETSYGMFLGRSNTEPLIKLPGATDMVSDFATCEALSRQAAPVEFYFAGGPLVVWLQDTWYLDNVAVSGLRNGIRVAFILCLGQAWYYRYHLFLSSLCMLAGTHRAHVAGRAVCV
jgi:hypothetical protein